MSMEVGMEELLGFPKGLDFKTFKGFVDHRLTLVARENDDTASLAMCQIGCKPDNLYLDGEYIDSIDFQIATLWSFGSKYFPVTNEQIASSLDINSNQVGDILTELRLPSWNDIEKKDLDNSEFYHHAEDGSALFVCSGKGEEVLSCSKSAIRAAGIDMSPYGIACSNYRAQASGIENVEFFKSPFEEFDPKETFDAAYILFPDPRSIIGQEPERVYDKIRSLVNAEGHIVLVTENDELAFKYEGLDKLRQSRPLEEALMSPVTTAYSRQIALSYRNTHNPPSYFALEWINLESPREK